VDLNSLIEGSLEMFRTLLGGGIELTTEPGYPVGTVMADPGQMHRVLMNLLVNARDAMPNAAKSTSDKHHHRLKRVPDREPRCHARANGGSGGQRHGHGNGRRDARHLFEPFFTTKEPGKGTGLGLSTVYGIVKQSGGWIRVRSEAGSGTTFSIHLPCIIDPGPQAVGRIVSPVSAASDMKESYSRITVLVVEDQEQVRALSRRFWNHWDAPF